MTLEKKLLFLILAIGLLLRALPILWGIPLSPDIHSFHPDEPKVHRSILQFPSIYWSTKTFPAYGTFFQYTLGTLLIPVKLAVKKILDLGPLYSNLVWLIGRFFALLLGTASIYFLFLFIRKIISSKAALLSALFLAIAPIHVLNGSLMTLDIMMGTYLILGCLLASSLYENPSQKKFIWLGVLLGVLFSTKVTMGAFLIIPFTLGMFRCYDATKRGESFFREAKKSILPLGLSLFIGLVIFFLYNPHVYLDFEKYAAFYAREKVDFVDRRRVDLFSTLSLIWKHTATTLGPWTPLLFFLGLPLPDRRWRRYKIAIMLFLLVYYGFWRWFIRPRFVTTIAPFLCLFAGYIVAKGIESKRKLLHFITIGFLVLFIGHTLFLTAIAIQARLQDPRIKTSKFIRENFDANTTVGIGAVSKKYSWKWHPWRYPKIDFEKYTEVSFLENPDLLILSTFDTDAIEGAFAAGKVTANYTIPKEHHKDWYRYEAPAPDILAFYDHLLIRKTSPYKLLAAFLPIKNTSIPFAPSEIRIYQRLKDS